MSVSMAMGLQMQLGVSRIDVMRSEGFDEGEIASLMTFVRGELVEPVSLGSDGFTPLDEREVIA